MSSRISIERCIERVSKRDIEALEQIYNTLRIELMGTAFSVLGDIDRAADAVQETMIRVLECSALFRPETNGRAWILTICRNKAIDMVRRERRMIYIDGTEIGAMKCSVENRVEDTISVHGELSKLPHQDREIVIAHSIQNYTFREIAGKLNMNPSTVRSRYYRTMARIRKRLQENMDTENG